MWYRFHLTDVRVVGYYLGTLVLFTGVAMVIPFLVALVCGETDPALDFLIGMGICFCIGGILHFLQQRPGKLNRRQALLVTGFSYIVIASVASIPMMLSGSFETPLDAVFESVSVLTTTGVSIMNDYNHMAYSHLIWRVLMVVIGGQGIIVIALSLGFFGRSGGASSVYQAEGRIDHVLPNIVSTARFIGVISISVIAAGTIICTILGLIIGIDPLRSLITGFCLTVSSFDTGGITPHSSSLIYYHSVLIEAFCLIFMLLGIINFAVYAYLLKGKSKELFGNIEMRSVAIWITAITILLSIVMIGDGYLSGFTEILRRGMFMVVSASTTTGFQTIYPNQLGLSFSGGAMLLIAIVMLVGGTSGSTAGGIKVVRLTMIFKWIGASITSMLLPETAVQRTSYHQFTDRELTSEMATRAMIIFTLFTFTASVGTMLAIAFGYDATASAFESVTCVTNNGFSTGIISADMPLVLKVFYMVEMWAGRLEFIALLAVFAGLITSLFKLKEAKG